MRCNDDVILLSYTNYGDAGMDIRSIEDISILPNETKVIKTGLKMVISLGYELQVRPRSGLSLNTGLRIANAPGTIDSGYRGEIGIIVWNSSNQEYKINKGDRIAQIVLSKYENIVFEEVEDLISRI